LWFLDGQADPASPQTWLELNPVTSNGVARIGKNSEKSSVISMNASSAYGRLNTPLLLPYSGRAEKLATMGVLRGNVMGARSQLESAFPSLGEPRIEGEQAEGRVLALIVAGVLTSIMTFILVLPLGLVRSLVISIPCGSAAIFAAGLAIALKRIKLQKANNKNRVGDSIIV
jgi:hypothetical protein